MNVGIVLPYLKVGGTERQARYIARHLRKSGHRVTLVVAESTGAFRDEVDVETVSLGVPFSKTYAPLLTYQLISTIRSRQFDLLLSRAWNMNVVTAVAGQVSRTRYVLFLSGSTRREGQESLKLAVEGMLLRRATRIISVSEAAKENCLEAYELSPSLIQVIHNGIRIGEIKNLSKQASADTDRMDKADFNVLFVGRVIHRKGVDVLLRAIQRLNERVKVWIVGGGQIRKFKALAGDLGVRDRVFFLGEKENPFPELGRADLFVLPSRSEGFPNVLLEAMALGRPVLAADCETGPDEIIDGSNGRLFPVEDCEALSREIEELIKADEEREKLEREAQRTVRKHFSLETQLSKMEETLQCAASDSAD